MAGKEEYRIFVGGLAWDITERQLENAFSRFGKILACQYVSSRVMVERDTGRPRGFGFVTYADRRAMDDAIAQMHGCEFGDRLITVNAAQPRMADGLEPTFQRNYSSGGRGATYRSSGNDRPVAGPDDCFKCGRPGHWARDCPSSGGRGGPPTSFPPRSRFAGPPDRFADRDRDRFVDDRYDGGRYNDRERFDSRDSRYSSRDRYMGDRYQAPGGERFVSERYGTSERYVGNGYGKERGYERGSGERYGGGGPARNERNYRNRPEPYGRPNRGGRPSSFERY